MQDFLDRAQPVISVDMLKKEVIEACEHNEQDSHFKNQPADVIFYGNHNKVTNATWQQVGIDRDTVELSVKSIRQWWLDMGQRIYLNATELLLINTDCGSSNRYPIGLWKTELQKFASQLGIKVQVAHLPPGIKKWSNIEYRIYYQFAEHWRDQLPISREVVINSIGNATIQKLSGNNAQLDRKNYDSSDGMLCKVNQKKSNLHKNWNYLIVPCNDAESRIEIR